MSFEYQVHSEEVTQKETIDRLYGWLSHYPDILDVLFESAYFTGTPQDVESPEGYYHALSHNMLLRFPYTVRAICLILEKGFYYEAISLVRNLFESFIQLRYFHRHPDQVKDHVLTRRIKFKVMFEEIAPGFYADMYGRLLSEFAHSGLGSSLFRVRYSSPTVGVTTMGSQYNESHFSYSSNQLVVLLYGVLNYLPEFFPQYRTLVLESTETKRKQSLSWLESMMNEHIANKPGTKIFYDLVNPMIRK
jgi:hypothetical protein